MADRYEIERPLAIGGMSTLYVARTLATGERVALKVLDARLAQDAAGVQRFLREVRLASSIGHPGLVQVRDAGVARGPDGVEVPYLAMELLDGQNLAEILASGRCTQHEATGWFRELLAALAAVHARGVVHRDLKFENVFAARAPGGHVTIKLIDFGIARELLDARAPTTTGTALGTVYYMAPEQSLDARSVTASADVYALGVMLYQLLAGVYPFDGESPHAVIVRAHTTPHEPLGVRVPDLDARLAALVDRCLSREPLARPADAAALGAELTALLDDPGVAAFLAARRVDPATFVDGDAAALLVPSLDLGPALSSRLTPPAPADSAAPRRGVVWALALAVALLSLVVASLVWHRPTTRAVALPRPSTLPTPPAAARAEPASLPTLPPSVATRLAPVVGPDRVPEAPARLRGGRRVPAVPAPEPAALVLPPSLDPVPAPAVRPAPDPVLAVVPPPPAPPARPMPVVAPRPPPPRAEPEAPFTF